MKKGKKAVIGTIAIACFALTIIAIGSYISLNIKISLWFFFSMI